MKHRRWMAAGLAAAFLLIAPASKGASTGFGLKVTLNRATHVYAIDDELVLTISVERDAAVSILLVETDGSLTRIVPRSPGAFPLIVRAGTPMRFPGQGGLTITPPAGRYELRFTAEAPPASRSLSSADSRLAGRDVREQASVTYDVESRQRRGGR